MSPEVGELDERQFA
jgi:ABC-type multidrug transport system permease subunit